MYICVVRLRISGSAAAVHQQNVGSRLEDFGNGWVHMGGTRVQKHHLWLIVLAGRAEWRAAKRIRMDRCILWLRAIRFSDRRRRASKYAPRDIHRTYSQHIGNVSKHTMAKFRATSIKLPNPTTAACGLKQRLNSVR